MYRDKLNLKESNLKIENNLSSRSNRLAVTPCKSARKADVRASIMDDKNIDNSILKNVPGRHSYAEKAREQGLYIATCAAIRKFRVENRDSTYKEVGEYLVKMFPTIFKPFKYASNVSKTINSDIGWTRAYFSSGLNLVELAEQRMYEVLEKEDIDDSIKINAYDKINKYEQYKKELELNNNDDADLEINVNISGCDDNE